MSLEDRDDETKSVRVQLDMTPEEVEQLMQAKALTGSRTRTQTMMIALRVLVRLLLLQREGFEIVLRKDGKEKTIFFLF